MRISANIICKNEIENISKCINSILDYVYEVIVIDTGSTDGTFEYLQHLEKTNDKVRVYHKEWNNNFADMRNYALELSTGDYILVIDGDMELINFEFNEGADYYICNVQIYNDTTDNLYSLPITLFFKNNGVKFYGARHATIERDILKIGGNVAQSKIRFSHPVISKEELQKKMEHNLEVHLKQLEEEPGNDTVYYHLCRTYYYLKNYDNAIKYGIEAINKPLNKDSKATAAILIYLSFLRYGIYEPNYLTLSLRLIPKQIYARILLLDYIKDKEEKLANELYEEIESLSYSKNTDLSADYILNKNQLNILKGEIQCHTIMEV